MKPIVLSVAIVGALALAPPALAVRTIAPPGNSSAGEYLETVPTSNGNRRSDSFPGGGGGGGHRGGPSASTVHRLGGLGTAGKGALAFARRTAPSTARPPRAFSRPAGAVADAGTSGPSPLDAIVKRVLGSSDSGGTGTLLPLTLLVAAIALSAVALARRRQIR